jgi:small-conductance mechanosensitive channel
MAIKAWRRFALALLLMAASTLFQHPAWADGPPPAAAGATTVVSTDDLKTLLLQLQNDAERQKLIAAIQALIAARGQEKAGGVATAPGQSAAEAPGATAIAIASDGIRKASDSLVNGAGMLLDLPRFASWLQQQAADPDIRAVVLGTILRALAMLIAGIAVEFLLALLLRLRRKTPVEETAQPLWLRMVFLAGSLLKVVLLLAGFALAAYLVLPLTRPGELQRPILLTLLSATVALRAILGIGRALLAPKEPGRRPLLLTPETGSYWYVWLRRLALPLVAGYVVAECGPLLGLSPDTLDVILKAIGFIFAALLVVLVLQNREPVRQRIRGASRPGRNGSLGILRSRIAEIWHIAALIYVAAIYAVWALDLPGGFAFILRASALSALAIAAARILADLADALLRRFFAIGHDLNLKFPGLQERAGRYLPILTVSLRVALYLAAALTVLQAWGLGSFDWLSSDLGRLIVGDVAVLLVTVLVAVAIWEASSLVIGYYLAKNTGKHLRQVRQARAATLLPLLRRTIAILLIVFVAMIGLSAIGLNIGPLLAGAGVVGIAVGLGAQSYVKDLINGLNLLLEDTFSVGDVVTIGADSGVVEGISMRTVHLRDGNGALRTIPFSDITRVINMTRDYGNAVFDIPVDFQQDVGRIIAIVEKLGAELAADPEFSPDVLAPMDKPVLTRFADYAMILHCQIRTLPGRQWALQNEFNRRLKERFDAEGIVMPYPSQRLVMAGQPNSGNGAATAESETAAAAPAAEPPKQPGKGPTAPGRRTTPAS